MASATTPPTTATPATRTVRLSYAGGQPGGETGRVLVALGSPVDLIVTSDVADEVHLHGYDQSAPVVAGGTAIVSFTADIPGVFEVELEELGEQLAKLEVS